MDHPSPQTTIPAECYLEPVTAEHVADPDLVPVPDAPAVLPATATMEQRFGWMSARLAHVDARRINAERAGLTYRQRASNAEHALETNTPAQSACADGLAAQRQPSAPH